MSTDISENIKVYIRQRPVISSDVALSETQTKTSGIEGFSKDFTKCSYYSATNGMTQDFRADRIFAQMSYQDALYDEIARPLVESALLGYSGTIVAYGPTCSGKTFTMRGGPGDDRGIMPRCIEQLLGSCKSSNNVSIWASYVQIYCESVSDLLTSSSPSDGEKQLSIREKNGQVFVEGLSKFPVNSVDDLWILLSRGDENRNTASTNMNETSSRSHAALMIQVIIKDDSTSATPTTLGTHRESTLMLVDLAGSERASASDGRDYMRLEEAKAINLSLSALGNCMSAMAEGRGHIPYRDSKLTRLLQGCLGGTSRTSVIVNIPPGEDVQGETLSALRFASRASKVKVMAKVNRIKDYEAMYLEAKKTLDMLGKASQGGAESVAKDELLRKKDQQIEDLSTEVESLKKQLQVYQIGSKYINSGDNAAVGSSASGKLSVVGPMDNAAWTEKLNEQTARHAQEIDSISRTFQARINQHKNNERQLAKEISDLHDDSNRDKQALLTAVQEQRQLQEKRNKSETHLKARIEELLTELNDRRTEQENYEALQAQHKETLAQLKAAQTAMYDMVTKDQVKEMESLFLDTVTKLSTRVNFLEKAKKASSILTEGEYQMQQQQQQSQQQQSQYYQPVTTSSNGNSRVRIEPGGKIRTSSLNTLNPNTSGKG